MKYYILYGGSWCDRAINCRSTYNGTHSPNFRYDAFSFRLIKKLKK